MLHTTLFAAVNPWPGTLIACVALCAVCGWPKFGSVNKGILGMKEVKDLTKSQTAMAHDLGSIKSDLAELKQAVAELDRVLKSVE